MKYSESLTSFRMAERSGHTSWSSLRHKPLVNRMGDSPLPPGVSSSPLLVQPERRRPKRVATRDWIVDLVDEVRLLRARVEELEANSRRWRPVTSDDEGEKEPVEDPFGVWLEAHRHVLEQHPNEHIAIHPEHGIVFHSADDEEFGRWLEQPSEYDDDQVLVTHSSLYI